jgi:hypothetical protein
MSLSLEHLSATGRALQERREESLIALGELESTRTFCPVCGAQVGVWCRPGLRVHSARAEQRVEELGVERQ